MKEKLNVNQIPELKQAILDLTTKEKDQMLVRLINKDQILIEQLHFKLLEDEFDLIKRFEDLKNEINEQLDANRHLISAASVYLRGKLYLSLIRNLSGKINHFAKVTKSTSYELELRTFLLVKSSEFFKTIQNEDTIFAFKARVYQVTKLKSILKLLEKQHEDLKYDFVLNYVDDLEMYVFNSLRTEINLANLNIEALRNH